MKIKQIIQAPPNLMILCNCYEEDGMASYVQDVRAYGLMDNGEVLPLIEAEKGNLVPIDKELFVRTWFEGEE